ncbi:MAG: D-alanyl-D-alanine carboxypeptidase [Lachnospiraceae bacterium]|nr:D-alanyl-D-alanine carboxypeptidase [Lachnospiraceae bacterium]
MVDQMKQRVFPKMYRLAALLLALAIAAGGTHTASVRAAVDDAWLGMPQISAQTAILMEQTTGCILYEKASQQKMYPASLTKILTALIVLENCSLSEEVTFSHDAVFNTYGSSAGIKEGEILTVEQCLYVMMLVSANEVAYALAEHVSGYGRIDEFSKLMNEYAERLGCVNSHFHNPHGLPDEQHWTCAYDLALITQAAMRNETYRKITYTQIYILPTTNLTDEERHCSNHHQMRYAYRLPKFKYEFCIGGKTGYTDDAGYTLVTNARKDGMELICVVMGAGSPYTDEMNQYTDTSSLFETAFKNFTMTDPAASDLISLNHLPTFGRFNTLFSTFYNPLRAEGGGQIVIPRGVSPDLVETKLLTVPYAEQSGDSSRLVATVEYRLGSHVLGTGNVIFTPSGAGEIPSGLLPENSTEEQGEIETKRRKISWPEIHLPEIHLTEKGILILVICGVILLLLLGLFLYRQLVVIPRRREASRRARYRNLGTYQKPPKRGSRSSRDRRR